MVLTRFGRPDAGHGIRGAALVDALIALVVLGLGAAAVSATMLGASHGKRAAALDGRRAELAVRTADRLRTGLLSGSSGSFVASVGGERFEVRYARRDDVAPGAIELAVGPASGGPQLRLAPAAPVP